MEKDSRESSPMSPAAVASMASPRTLLKHPNQSEPRCQGRHVQCMSHRSECPDSGHTFPIDLPVPVTPNDYTYTSTRACVCVYALVYMSICTRACEVQQ